MKKIICTIFVIIGSYCSAYSQDREVKIPIPEEKEEIENNESLVIVRKEKFEDINFKEQQNKNITKINSAGFFILAGGVGLIVNSFKKEPSLDLARAGFIGIALGGLTLATIKIPIK
jgi:hypothetical protein